MHMCRVPSHPGTGTRTWFGPRACSRQDPWLTVVEGEFGDKIKGCPGLCDVLLLTDNSAQPLLPVAFRAPGELVGPKAEPECTGTALFPAAHKAGLLLFPLKPGVISCAVAI